jgi:hypothetical protein
VNISECFQWVKQNLNKEQSGSFSPEEFNLACNVVSRELFNVKVGLPETYAPGAPYPPQAYQITQKITDDLRNFIKDVSITKSNGFFPLPADYAAFSSLSYDYTLNQKGGQPISEKRFFDVVSDATFRMRQDDNVIMPTLKYPIATYRESGILVAPREITRLTLTYLRFPAIPVFGYTVGSNDEYVYDPTTSTQIDFPATLHPEFGMRVGRYFGITLREETFYAMTQERIKSGQ